MERLGRTKEKWEEIKYGLLLALAMCFMVFIYAPLEIYSYNKDEFWYDIYDLLTVFIPIFAGMLLLLAGLAFLISAVSKKLYHVIFAIGSIGFLCTYIQGTFMAQHLPRMDGTIPDWTEYSGDRMCSLLLWIAVTVIVCVLIKLLSCARYIKIAGTAAFCMTLMLLLTMCSFIVTTQSFRGKLNAVTTTETLFDMSENKNFIIFVLDSVDSETLYDIMQEDASYQEVFEDFTYFPNTVGAYPYTVYALPYILTGEYYKNEEEFDDYNIRAYTESELMNSLRKEGYNINVFAESEVLPKNDDRLFSYDNSYKEFRMSSYWEFTKLQIKLVGLRYAPYQLKEKCMIYTDWLDDLRVSVDGEAVYGPDNLAFYREIQNCEITYLEEPCFKYIHLEGAHLPFTYDENLNIVEESGYADCVKASVTLTREYLQKLKAAGVYDNAVIIVMSDHGYSEELVWSNAIGRQNPILFIKGIGESHPLEISQAPISFEDLQEAYKRLMAGGTGRDAFDYKDGDSRERRYMYYYYGDENHMYEYLHQGHAFVDDIYPTGKAFIREQ